MPLYEFECGTCRNRREEYRPVDLHDKPAVCEKCNHRMKRRYDFTVIPDMVPYLDPNIGANPTWVKSKAHRRQLMKQNGVSER
jgi:putative FmdB family regulatory protein